MALLTIFIKYKNKEDSQKICQEIQSQTDDIQNVNFVAVCAEEGSCWDLKDILSQVDTQFVAFYSDNVQINRSDIQHLSQVLQNLNGSFYQQQIKKIGSKHERESHQYLYFPSFIFETEILRSIDLIGIPEHLKEEKILLDFTERNGDAVLLEDALICTTDIMENDVNLYEPSFHKSWYLDDLEDFLLPYIKGKDQAGKDLQKRVFSDIVLRFFMNLDNRDKFVLNDQEVEQFFAIARQILQYIDDDVIAKREEYRKMPVSYTYLFLLEKHYGNLDFSVSQEDGIDSYYINGQWLEDNFVDTRIEAINYTGDQLVINCEIRGDFFLKNPEKDFHVFVNKKETTFEKDTSYNLIKAFGRSILRFYRLSFSIPEELMKENVTIAFTADIQDGHHIQTPLEFKRPASRLIDSKYSYYTFGNHMLVCRGKQLLISDFEASQVFVRECHILAKVFLHVEDWNDKFGIIFLRLWYWLTKGIYSRKKIWIFFDKLYKAGDNAEYLFSYCMEHAKDADCYYIITKESADYARLKKQYGKHILVFSTMKQKLMMLHADIVYATHSGVWRFCGFTGNYLTYFRNLLKGEVVCIQHGLTIQDIAQYQNKLQDNTQLYFCASKYEIANLKKPIYGYQGDELKLTGSPRYDGLINHDQRQILITPTWRRNIVVQGNEMGTAKDYNPHFKDTIYFEIYNRLINDERLIQAAKKYHYKLLYLLHPTLSAQIEDFDTNENLKIVQATSDISYEKVLTESSLMLTDYSGVQFDFAYMKKPVLYYQPEELPPQYEETVYKYDTMGFGPVITQYEDVILALCEYMANGCKMDIEYQNRVDDFFAYTDHNNCKRIYKSIEQ